MAHSARPCIGGMKIGAIKLPGLPLIFAPSKSLSRGCQHKVGIASHRSDQERVIAQFPNRVQPAIDYLNHQQPKCQINNPVGYLYEVIFEGWNLAVPQAIVPAGFSEWFDQMKAQGVVVAATAIDGMHHTLHIQQGWVPTAELMENYHLR